MTPVVLLLWQQFCFCLKQGPFTSANQMMRVKTWWPCPTLRSWKWRYLFLDRKRLEPREFPWLWVSFGFFCDVHFWCQVWRMLLQYLQSDRQSLFSNLPFYLQISCWHYQFYNLHNTKMSISLNQKKMFQKGKGHSSLFKKPFKYAAIFFPVIYT